jgi:DNA polymerase elongation subunit (family B)
MPRGWVLDANSSLDGESVVLWLKGEDGTVERRAFPFSPPFYVGGERDRLEELGRELSEEPRVASVDLIALRTDVFEPLGARRPVLSVVPKHHGNRKRLATHVDALGGFVSFTLYDVDLSAPQLFYIEHGLYPFAPVAWSGHEVHATESPTTLDYAPPPLRIARLAVEVRGARAGRPRSPEDPIARIHLGETIVEAADERAMLEEFRAELGRQDPDILLTRGGDDFDVPHLYRRAVANGFHETTFVLGREPVHFGLNRKGTTFESYGRILHRAPTYPLAGRFHLDLGERFVEDVGLIGFIEMARLSRLGLQVVSRQSPGTAFSAMELAVALEDGLHIPWKKNFPEQEKTAALLVAADRGGFILTPKVGLATDVEEFDFVSLFPSIMVQHNLSIETLNCSCCPESPHRAPGLGYRSCTQRKGIVPRTLEPILARRLHFKQRRKTSTGTEKARYEELCKAWKWVLVTSFGYQGYRNARFGRIEVHEAINAYARQTLTDLLNFSQSEGWSVLHGIVDSLWMTAPEGADAEAFARRVTDRTGLTLGYEGKYRWIVFLPNRAHGFGVPQRYYGYYTHGEFKVRGIEVRRGDACRFVQGVQHEALDVLAKAEDADAFRSAVLKALDLGRERSERLQRGEVPGSELVLAHRVTQELRAYRVFSDGVAAMRQLEQEGIGKGPGQEVGYLIADRASRDWRRKVVAEELLRGDEGYDARAYTELLARSFETLFLPFGFTFERILDRWGYGAPVRGYRATEHRSCEHPAQTRLAEAG